MMILTHRGLDPSKPDYFAESSREAFSDQLTRGFGLEFDLQFTKDGKIVVFHDKNVNRHTKGSDTRTISDIDLADILKVDFSGNHLASFKELLAEIAKRPENTSINAVHIKSSVQKPENLRKILTEFEGADPERFIFFDLALESARFLKQKNPALHLAPSLSHPYDILRYNSAVGGTLLPMETVLKNRDVYDWVWLDEWDRIDKGGGTKSLYNKETFKKLREAGFKIALVTPELHATSPGLLGGEAHPDASSRERLIKRFKEIISLKPDAVCTDFPDTFKKLAQ